ncbi:hypothetical protein AK812_SmicGene28324 [Symbiodinium microadriaticum]|uniref:Uncharacterized protein n=1 Tax=Symbiodinium microadriaticum TaxID=2951 RepID=A0A1Q9D4N4_SYMMI|nr:hypothetical protein AK812_SmicGene28324 [Symbiodinium microadriaticum]
MRSAYEQAYGSLDESVEPSDDYVSAKTEEVESGEIVASSLTEVTSKRNARTMGIQTTVDTTGHVRLIKQKSKGEMPQNTEQLRTTLRIEGNMWCFLGSKYKNKVFFRDMTPEVWLDYANYILGDKCYLMQVPTPGKGKGKSDLSALRPPWIVVLNYEYEMRREAVQQASRESRPLKVNVMVGRSSKGNGKGEAKNGKGTTGRYNLVMREVDIKRDATSDLLDSANWNKIFTEITAGEWDVLLLSPPCSTWSRARFRYAGKFGAKPLRNSAYVWGFPWLEASQRELADRGNFFIHQCIRAVQLQLSVGKFFLWEHPEDLGATSQGESPASIWQLAEDAASLVPLLELEEPHVATGQKVPGPDEILECVAVSQETREAVFGISADISSAHRLVLIRKADWPKLGCRARSQDRVIWLNTVGTFGISSAAYWWTRLFGCVGRWVVRLMMSLWAMQMIYVDDLHLVAAGPQKYLVIWMMIAAYEAVGTPFAYRKFRGGLHIVFFGYHLSYDSWSAGLSEKPCRWVIDWIDRAEANGWMVLGRHFIELTGRLTFVGQVLRMPLLVLIALVYIRFCLKLFPKDAPWLFKEDGSSQWASTAAELLGTMAALKAFGWLEAGEQGCGHGVDNLRMRCGNLADNLWTRTPQGLMMQMADVLIDIGGKLRLHWRPREENQEADNLTSEIFDGFDVGKRVPLEFGDLPLELFLSLQNAYAEFDQKRKDFKMVNPVKDGDNVPIRPFPWQFKSAKEYYEVQDELEGKYAIRLVSKARDSKGRGKALDEWHCHPVGRGRADKQDREGNSYTILGWLPPSKASCSICWMDGHWKSQCKARDLSYEMWEPALTVLQPKEKLRKFFPLRNIAVEKHKDDENPFNKYFPAVGLCDYGSISSQIRDANKKYLEEKRKDPDMFPELEPPLEEQQEVRYAASKKMARPDPVSDAKPGQGTEVVNLEDESQKDESKKSDKQNVRTEEQSLPPGHWENRTQKEAQKEALRKKYEEHSEQKLRETLERSLGKGPKLWKHKVEDNRQWRSIVSRIKEKDGGKEEDLGSDEEEEKVKVVEKEEEGDDKNGQSSGSGKPYDKQAIDSVEREDKWTQSHIDAENEQEKEREVDRVRMAREGFHDLAEWFVMDETDEDDDWCVVGEQDTTEVIRAVQTEEHVPEEGLELIILDSGNTGILLEDAQGNQIKSAGMVTAVIDVEQGDCWTVPDDFTELLDSTPNGKWTVMDDGTPFIEQRLWIPEEPFLDGSGGLQCLEKEVQKSALKLKKEGEEKELRRKLSQPVLSHKFQRVQLQDRCGMENISHFTKVLVRSDVLDSLAEGRAEGRLEHGRRHQSVSRPRQYDVDAAQATRKRKQNAEKKRKAQEGLGSTPTKKSEPPPATRADVLGQMNAELAQELLLQEVLFSSSQMPRNQSQQAFPFAGILHCTNQVFGWQQNGCIVFLPESSAFHATAGDHGAEAQEYTRLLVDRENAPYFTALMPSIAHLLCKNKVASVQDIRRNVQR